MNRPRRTVVRSGNLHCECGAMLIEVLRLSDGTPAYSRPKREECPRIGMTIGLAGPTVKYHWTHEARQWVQAPQCKPTPEGSMCCPKCGGSFTDQDEHCPGCGLGFMHGYPGHVKVSGHCPKGCGIMHSYTQEYLTAIVQGLIQGVFLDD